LLSEDVKSRGSSLLADVIPAEHRAAVDRALQAVFGSVAVTAIGPITGGASGARVFRIAAGDAERLLRIETNRGGAHDPARQFACMRIASDAGVAPRVYYSDASDGVAITDFVRTSAPEDEDARHARLASLARAVATMHGAPLFPPFMSFFGAMDFLIGNLERSGVLPSPEAGRLASGYREIAAVYPQSDAELVSSHNDLNPANVLFEGERPWIIDWELAFAADRFIDIAALINFFAIEPGDEELVLRSYFGDEPTGEQRARAYLMRQLNRIYYGSMMLQLAVMAQPGFRLTSADLDTRSFREVRPGLAPVSTEEGRIRFACVFLNDALKQIGSARFREALGALRSVRIP
jgi:aminoglycoside phosphotransferase (APT) family kinase protein